MQREWHGLRARCVGAFRSFVGVVAWGSTGGALGLTFGGVLGILCGAAYATIHADFRLFASVAMHFAFTGAAAGAILGAFGSLIDGQDPPWRRGGTENRASGRARAVTHDGGRRAFAIPDALLARMASFNAARIPRGTFPEDPSWN
jgi:hypothetical protein